MDPVKTHTFIINPSENSGEQLSLCTEFIPNGDPGVVFTNQSITLQSYCNCTTISLFGAQITPEILRQLANELDTAKNEAIAKL